MQNSHIPPIQYIPTFLEHTEHQELFLCLQKELAWKQYPITIFGKTMMQPRLVCFYADAGLSYTYSKTTLNGQGRHPALAELRSRIENNYKIQINSALCNWYRDGNDSMGRHADNEKELGPDPIIASVSLGEKRDIHFRNKQSGEKQAYTLEGGSLLFMQSGCQLNREHAIMKTKKPLGPRINLTFRYIYT